MFAVLTEKAMNGDDDQMRSPAKSDTLRSTDSASGGETLEDRSSKEVNQCLTSFLSFMLTHTAVSSRQNKFHFRKLSSWINEVCVPPCHKKSKRS